MLSGKSFGVPAAKGEDKLASVTLTCWIFPILSTLDC